MRFRTITVLASATAAVLIGSAVVAGTSFLAARDTQASEPSTFIDGVPAPQLDTFIDGMPAPQPDTVVDGLPAPMVLAPSQLTAAPITLVPGQALIVKVGGGGDSGWTGEGGTSDGAIVRFTAATSDENVSFFAQAPGQVSAWLVGSDAQRLTFTVTVVAF